MILFGHKQRRAVSTPMGKSELIQVKEMKKSCLNMKVIPIDDISRTSKIRLLIKEISRSMTLDILE